MLRQFNPHMNTCAFLSPHSPTFFNFFFFYKKLNQVVSAVGVDGTPTCASLPVRSAWQVCCRSLASLQLYFATFSHWIVSFSLLFLLSLCSFNNIFRCLFHLFFYHLVFFFFFFCSISEDGSVVCEVDNSSPNIGRVVFEHFVSFF